MRTSWKIHETHAYELKIHKTHAYELKIRKTHLMQSHRIRKIHAFLSERMTQSCNQLLRIQLTMTEFLSRQARRQGGKEARKRKEEGRKKERKKEGRRKDEGRTKDEGRRTKEEGRKEEGRRKKEEGRRKKEEGRRKKEDSVMCAERMVTSHETAGHGIHQDNTVKLVGKCKSGYRRSNKVCVHD